MLKAKELARALARIMQNSEVGKNARIQVRLPQGEYRSPDGFWDTVKHIELYLNYIQVTWRGKWVNLKRL